jgi:hypothetical protein
MLIFMAVKPCGFSGRYPVFGRSEDGGNMFLRNVGSYLQAHKALLPRTPASVSSPPQESQTYHVYSLTYAIVCDMAVLRYNIERIKYVVNVFSA